MHLAYVDKLIKDNNGEKYQHIVKLCLIEPYMQKEWKQKFPMKRFMHFWPWLRKKRTNKSCVDKGTEFAIELEKLCKAEGIQVYSTMSETKAEFDERRLRSLKNVLYRYKEDYRYKYLHKLSQFVTTMISGKNCSIGLVQENIRYSFFFSVLYSKPPQEYRKPKFKMETDFVFRGMTYTSRRVMSLNLQRKFLKLVQFFRENLQHAQEKMKTKRFSALNLIRLGDQNHLTMKSFTIVLTSNRSSQIFPDNTLS